MNVLYSYMTMFGKKDYDKGGIIQYMTRVGK